MIKVLNAGSPIIIIYVKNHDYYFFNNFLKTELSSFKQTGAKPSCHDVPDESMWATATEPYSY